MIAEETIRYDRAATALDWASVCRRLEAAIDGIVQRELRRFQPRLRTFTPDQQQAIQMSLGRIANKILDPVIRSLKQAVQQGDAGRITRICGLFDLAPLPLIQAREARSSGLQPVQDPGPSNREDSPKNGHFPGTG